ncbi:hypothetical protein Ahy_A07g036843 isoform B [Arachis hypogaea]|uniref:Uncharacterized protein n=1 Tax=Arachis hypogaea TaxID=3818 RepID=A0A445CH34_ARAHY|nr:hypothetical protein Ahy_A07g036843 isoform B [Arachis hypogaea]
MDSIRYSMEHAQDVSNYLIILNISNFPYVENKGGSSDEVESFRNASFSSLCNANDIVSPNADLIAEVHCIENKVDSMGSELEVQKMNLRDQIKACLGLHHWSIQWVDGPEA